MKALSARILVAPALAAFALGLSSGIALADSEGGAATKASVLISPTLVPVDGAFTTLKRDDDGVRFQIHTRLDSAVYDLSRPVQLQIAVFNNPAACNGGGAPIAECNPGQVFVANGGVLMGPSGLATPDGRFHLKGSLGVGATDSLLAGQPLTDPEGAEIQLLIRAFKLSTGKYSTAQFSVQDPRAGDAP